MIIPMVKEWNDNIGVNYGYTLIWFIDLYLTGAYISKYGGSQKVKKPIEWLSCYLAISVFTFILKGVIGRMGFDFYLNPYNSPLTYFQAFFLFLAFKDISIGNERIANTIIKIAPLTMSSYLFHCQEDIGPLLWEITNPKVYANDSRLIIETAKAP